MKTEWLVTDVTPVGSPDRADRAILGVTLDVFLANSGHFCGQGATLWCRNPLLSPNVFSYRRLMKTEWLVTAVTTVGSPDRAEDKMLRLILDMFWPNQATFVVGEPLWDVRDPS